MASGLCPNGGISAQGPLREETGTTPWRDAPVASGTGEASHSMLYPPRLRQSLKQRSLASDLGRLLTSSLAV